METNQTPIRQTQVLITPEMASIFLQKNVGNRRVSKDRVNVLAEQIQKGNWIYDANPIRFDVNNILIDGQNRLMAIVKSNTAVMSDIVYGLSEQSRLIEGTGRPKTTSDVISMMGYKNSHNLVAQAKNIIAYNNGLDTWKRENSGFFSSTEIYDYIESNIQMLNDIISFSNSARKKFSGLTMLQYGTLFYITNKSKYAHKAEPFFNTLISGMAENAKDPARVLRERLIKNISSSHYKLGRYATYGFAIKAWNLYVQNKECTVLRFDESEDFPKCL
jgi:hypothetical protein